MDNPSRDVRPYPFDENDEDYSLQAEVSWLEEYLLDRDMPGSRAIVEAFSLIDDCSQGLLLNLLPPSQIDDLFSHYAVDEMTLRYAVKHRELLLGRRSMVTAALSDVLGSVDTSPEAIKPKFEPPVVKIWRDEQERRDAREAERQARYDEALRHNAEHGRAGVRSRKLKRSKK